MKRNPVRQPFLLALVVCLVSLLAPGAAAEAAQSKSEVRGLQRKLGIPADGVFGPQTKRAVRRFQRRHGLVADGIVGPVTRRALGLGSGRTLKRRSDGGDGGGGGKPRR